MQQSAGHSGVGGQSSLGQTVVIAAFFVATEFLEDVNASNKTDMAIMVVTTMLVNLLFILIVFTASNLVKELNPPMLHRNLSTQKVVGNLRKGKRIA